MNTQRSIAILLAAAALTITTTSCKKEATPKTPAKAATKTEAPTKGGQLQIEFETLKGKWLRPDGGYVIELKELLPDNKLTAAYFNPGPINVGEAKIYKENGFTKVFVKLQDQNYPGSTYTLIYDKDNDQLRGIYYQATYQQEYQVGFTRMPKQ